MAGHEYTSIAKRDSEGHFARTASRVVILEDVEVWIKWPATGGFWVELGARRLALSTELIVEGHGKTV